jgi:hypothetical protein
LAARFEEELAVVVLLAARFEEEPAVEVRRRRL